jgi:RHS repeat-associated protein
MFNLVAGIRSVFNPSFFRFRTLLLLLILLTESAVSAQTYDSTSGTTPSGLAPGSPTGSYSLSDFEDINLFNGNLNFNLPVMKISGRGKAGYNMTMVIGSQRWIFDVHEDFFIVTPISALDVTANLGPGGMSFRTVAGDPIECPIYSGAWYRETLTRLTFSAPDGTEYEFRDQRNNGNLILMSGCSPNNPILNRGRVWVTGDGSAVTFISDYDLYDDSYRAVHGRLLKSDGSNAPLSGFMVLRDGTRYRIDDGRVSWIRDTNGNKVTFTYVGFGSLREIKDSSNRTITITYGNPDIITFKGFGGASRQIKLHKAPLSQLLRSDFPVPVKTYQQLFPISGSPTTQFNPALRSAVELPDGRKYEFRYNYYGELSKVLLPTGGSVEYDWGPGPGASPSGVVHYSAGYVTHTVHYINEYRRLTERRTYSDETKLETRTNYTASHPGYHDPRPWTTTVDVELRNPSGTVVSSSKHYFFGSPTGSFISYPYDYNEWDESKEFKTEILSTETNTVLKRVEHTWVNPPGGPKTPDYHLYFDRNPAPNNPRIVETVTTLFGDTKPKVSKKTFAYDEYNNETAVCEYDFGSEAPGLLQRCTRTTYLTNNLYQNNVNYATDLNIHIRNLPKEVHIVDSDNNAVSLTYMDYDRYDKYSIKDCPGIVQHDSEFNTSYGLRGNLTRVTKFASLDPHIPIYQHNQYDTAGNVVKTEDGRGFTSDIDFSDCYGLPDDDARENTGPPELGGGSSYEFPTSVTNALDHTIYTQYDYYIGETVNAEDANGIVSSVSYNDPLDRPTQSIQSRHKVGGGTPSERAQTTFIYDDALRVISTIGDRDAFNDKLLTAKAYHDGLGRTWRSAGYDGDSWIIKDTQFDATGQVSQVSNPYRADDPDSASPPEGEWTKTVYDSLRRIIDLETPDGAHVTTIYRANLATIIDQAGKSRLTETDALERLVRVVEAPNELGYETRYFYDARGNLTKITQGSQERTFEYDFISRLIRATNPESGTISHVYDENGNLIERTDARGARTTITYDRLNRAISKVYSGATPEGRTVADATPPVFYFYDDPSTLPSGAPSWPGSPTIGRLIGVTYGSGADGTYHKYDLAGRITVNHQRQGNANYVTSYFYNLAGAVTREDRGNPVRRRIVNSYDKSGRLSTIQTGAYSGNGIVLRNLVSDISYTPFEELESETYGNGLIHSRAYNNRLQPVEISLGRPDNLESIFRINYIFGTAYNVNAQDPEIILAQNNGNIARIKYFISGTLQYAQTCQYDPIDRLRFAVEHNNGTYNDGARAWYQTFLYDQHGNRAIDVEKTSNNVDGNDTALTPGDFSKANNRIIREGFEYDRSGNLIARPGGTFTYDVDNRLVTATVDGVTSNYFYNGFGHRVRRVVGGAATRYVYGADGLLIEERNDSTNVVIKDYFYRGGDLVATTKTGTSGNYEYATGDHLGTPRAWTDDAGNLTAGGRKDNLFFGEDLFAGYGVRTTAQGYAASAQPSEQRKKFNSKEHDIETGLYYFLARYYSPVHGRFTSPDEFTGGPDELYTFAEEASENPTLYGELEEPQSLNKYQYCYNNPLKYVDPDGHSLWTKLVKFGVKAYKKGDVVAAATETAEDVITVFDSSKTPGERILAGLSAATEIAPVSFRDLKDGYGLVAGFFKRADNAGDAGKGILNRGGKFSDLDSAKGSNEVAHHMPQVKAGVTSKSRGPAIGITKDDHKLTRTFTRRGSKAHKEDTAANLNPRQRLAKDVRDLRKLFGSKYRRGSLEAIEYAKTLPEFKKKIRRKPRVEAGEGEEHVQ